MHKREMLTSLATASRAQAKAAKERAIADREVRLSVAHTISRGPQQVHSQSAPLSIAERWAWWRNTLGSPRFVCAPMVLQSELAFRMLVRRHGTDLCYAPMIPAREFLALPAGGGPADAIGHPETGKPDTQGAYLTSCPADRPLLAQIGGSDPEQVLAVALLLQDKVDGIDINFGCPQRCAQRDGYGAFLMSQPETARVIVARLTSTLRVPVKMGQPPRYPAADKLSQPFPPKPIYSTPLLQYACSRPSRTGCRSLPR